MNLGTTLSAMLSLSDLRRLLHAITRLFTDKNILRSALRRLLLLWSILRSRFKVGRAPGKGDGDGEYGTRQRLSYVDHRREKDEVVSTVATDSSDSPYPPSTLLQTPMDDKLHLLQPGDILGPVDSIAYSLHPYALSVRNASKSSQDLGTIPMNQYTISYPSIPMYNQRNTSHLSFDRPYSRSQSPNLAVPRRSMDRHSMEISVRSRSASPSGSVIVPLPAVEGPSPEPSELPETLSHPRISPQSPEYFMRYDRGLVVPKMETNVKIPPMTTTYKKREDPLGWISCLHPEGARYFFHEQKRIFTDANLYDPNLLDHITTDIAIIYDFIRTQSIELAPTVDLVLDLVYDEEHELIDRYYFADHQSRTIFFLDEIDGYDLPAWHQIEGVTAHSHIGHEIEAQYWYHCQLFPTTLAITHEHVNELRDLLMHAIGDTMTSQTSTSPYDHDDLQKLLGLTNSLKKNVGTSYGGSTFLLSRLMHTFARHRFLNWHGEPCARLNRDQSVYGSITNKRTWLVKTLSPLLFSAPDIHLRSLEKMLVDGVMYSSVWTQSIVKLNNEWQEFILYAMVLLNANVALAIQTVDQDAHPYRSAAQIASYISTVASIGSIMLGLLLVRQNRTKAKESAEDAISFIHRRTHPTLGMETIAIMFSLPYALLMWAMVSFLTAFSLMCFEDSNIPTRLLVGGAWAAIAVLIFWCIWMAWERHIDFPADQLPMGVGATSIKDASSEHQRRSIVCAKADASKKQWQWTKFLRRPSCDSTLTVV
ncbi:hypothetical protein BDQ12DRAFT_738210 [Crucibulum laeve]|uniref:WW domain-containing protein n=1 Tax=Crucibulum laeve TaxID=68775 RepID=A0A5C3LNI6_9AGAR|nr:hypothetical protein BDQ12DRAFT_738210 [Crucibulum laeve]